MYSNPVDGLQQTQSFTVTQTQTGLGPAHGSNNGQSQTETLFDRDTRLEVQSVNCTTNNNDTQNENSHELQVQNGYQSLNLKAVSFSQALPLRNNSNINMHVAQAPSHVPSLFQNKNFCSVANSKPNNTNSLNQVSGNYIHSEATTNGFSSLQGSILAGNQDVISRGSGPIKRPEPQEHNHNSYSSLASISYSQPSPLPHRSVASMRNTQRQYNSNSHMETPRAHVFPQYSNRGVSDQILATQSPHSNTVQYAHQNPPVNTLSSFLQTSTAANMNDINSRARPLPGSSNISQLVSADTQTAIANIISLIDNSSSMNDVSCNEGGQTSHPQLSAKQFSHSQSSSDYMPAINSQLSKTAVPPQANHKGNMFNSNHYHNDGNKYYSPDMRNQQSTEQSGMLALQQELEQERAMRSKLQQRVIELTQRVETQHLVEESYECLSQKYRLLYSQSQQMSLVIQRYQALLKQVEQDKIMLYKENASHKAQESVANDKTMRYNILVERSKKMEEENSSLVLENEMYQRRYEKCIDEISKQVVQALLTQKALQEQCLQLQDRLSDLERENSEFHEAAVRQARQASSDSRLGWSYKGGKTRPHAASPSADSVRSMPAQHLYWKQSSISSLEPHQVSSAPVEKAADSPWTEVQSAAQLEKTGSILPTSHSAPVAQAVSIETEFPANNGSPKSTRRHLDLDRRPSSESLDSAYGRAFVKYSGKDVKYQRSVSSEALRDMKVTLRPRRDLTLPPISKSSTTPSISTAIHPWHSRTAHSAHGSHNTVVHAEVHTDLSPDSAATPTTSTLTDSGVVNDPFAYDADHILSKHQSLIVGSMEDVFSAAASSVRDCVISEEELVASNSVASSHSVSAPAPPPRPRSACPSESGETVGEAGDAGPPPLPPKQYKGSRRKYKPLPAEPPEPDGDSSDRNTDSESIQQEIKTLTSQIEFMSSATLH